MPAFNDVRSAIDWVYGQFQHSDIYLGHGTDDAWDEAVFLVLHCMGLPLDSDDTVLGQAVNAAQAQQIQHFTERRIKERLPLAYLMQRAWFAGLEFYVDERVLVPRSPLAELIEVEYRPWVVPDQVERVLDLCTGSGCIAIATAHYLPQVKVDAVDICADALAVAQHNVEQHQLQQRVALIQSDLFHALSGRRYDIIVSNPPYVDAQDMADLPAEFLHEPGKGLAAGADGLDIVKQILAQAADYLTPEGVLIVEVGNSQVALMEQYPDVPFTWLTFARGGEGVFLLSCAQLQQYFGKH